MLKDRSCVPCRGGIAPLSREKAEAYLQETPDWQLESNKITREFTFKDFKSAMAFVNNVAKIAEDQGHHPDIQIHWNKVALSLYTHKINGLHENDFILAAKIDALV